ncbi:N-acetylmuramoyl-L-alanine amidase [Clostridium gasigenes]|uniref:N-acetylmuramoyl-L-alanine amidase n=1 Tax=Clostridium gasigenes TaxID=94869 RepID=UPI0016246903|nr:N-acetylmuramoyl-L-alanine amidase [Clostridium gasigenes]MBB6622018.1 N-acetylmuramoyl-L-alanine amidase [Clostridium gasigenes]
MDTADRGGHNYQAQGANGYVNEVVEDRKINSATIKHLELLGHNANDVTPGNRGVDADLVYGVQMANNMDVDVFSSKHLNACYTTKEAMGCECVTYGDSPSVEIANRIRDNLVKLGFKYRENKVNKELYEVRAVVAPSVIVESFFCDSYADVQNYYRVGADEIGRAIAYGLVGKEFNIENNTIIEGVKFNMKNVVVFTREFEGDGILANFWASCLPEGIAFNNYKLVDWSKVENIYAIGGKIGTYTAYLKPENFIAGGANRKETMRNLQARLDR